MRVEIQCAVQRPGGVALAHHKAVALGVGGVGRIDVQHRPLQGRQDVAHGEVASDVSSLARLIISRSHSRVWVAMAAMWAIFWSTSAVARSRRVDSIAGRSACQRSAC